MEMLMDTREVSMSTGLGSSVDLRLVSPEEAVEGPVVCALDLAEQTGEKVLGLSLELARLIGIEQDARLQSDDLEFYSRDRPFHPDDFEIDIILERFLRLPANSSESLSLGIVKDRCFLADRSESFYRSISAEQWLRTVITTQMSGMILRRDEGRKSYYELDENAGLEILSNVVPRRAFLRRLEGMTATCGGHQCNGGFFPISAFCEEHPPRPACTHCALAEQLRIEIDRMRSDVELDKVLKFWFLGTKDVKPGEYINGGSEGAISRVLWRHGTFVRKRFFSGDVPHQNTQFNRELEVALTVSHPNIVHCFGCSNWATSADCDLFMEVLQEDLESFLSRLEDIGPSFSFRDSLEVLLQVAEAIKYLHEMNFIHGDLKLGNILMSKLLMHSDVPFYLVKVADFGNTQRVDSTGATVESSFDFRIGTYSYAAPEVRSCRKVQREIEKYPEDLQKIQNLQEALQKFEPRKIDVYSFGVVADHVVTGVINVEGKYPDGNGSSLLQSLIDRCQAREPQDRPSFAEICEMLLKVIKDDHEPSHCDEKLQERNAKRKGIDLGQDLMKKVAYWWASNNDSRGTR
ncbi:hypothetical protein KC19_3G177500 [Ceratodon purpureus]|uniref:Protein kinase domain-containing protein n=1 Tax=Ceratodon purpureus TaxID=3225 RepID=A0A8T0IMC6_CERPU|nr:hypothetical protein KC19_3G177500 [Ceratodon purpureus]